MRISIKSLGPINSGSIELETPLIVLTGPNNTGKSYLTYLIHGLSQYEDLLDKAELRKRILAVFSTEQIIRDISENKGDILASELISEKLPQLLNLLIPFIQESSYKIFSSKFIKSDFDLKSFSATINTQSSSIDKIRVLDDNISFVSVDGTVSNEAVPEKHLIIHGHYQSLLDVFYVLTLLSFDIILRNRTYFFPAERTAINLFAKHITATKAEIKDELDSDVIAGMSNEELGQRLRKQVKAAPKYPYAIKDYINFVNNFTRTEEGAFAPIAAQIEAILAGGKLQVDEFEQLLFTPNTSAVSLELHLSSSLVKSLSYLILYLRYTAKENDQVIIDEPELNLHPDLQITIARIIARMVNGGFKSHYKYA